MADEEPKNLFGGAGPVSPAIARLCVQCGEMFLSVEPWALCDQECKDAYEVRTGLGGPLRTERFHVEKFLEIGEHVTHGDRHLILTGVITRGPGATVGDFIAVDALAQDSVLLH